MAINRSEFTRRQINGKIYWLSKDRANFRNAKLQCSEINTRLTLFETNLQYREAMTAISGFFQSADLSNSNFWLDHITEVVEGSRGKSFRFSWEHEPFDNNVWRIWEPNGPCVFRNNPDPNACCARQTFSGYEPSGYRDVHGGTCEDIQYAFLCQEESKTTDPLEDVPTDCANGYVLTNDSVASCEDIDECSNSPPCDQVCHNNNGSFTCSCNSGYSLKIDGRACQDIDECVTSSPCNQLCNNNEGSFTCSCNSGYSLERDGRTCEDIDECSSSPCDQVCHNNDGSFTCSCNSGYSLKIDGRTCEDIDECVTSSPCNQLCDNNQGSFICSCNSGYSLKPDGRICEDVDECTNMLSCDQRCDNIPGSFSCGCLPGYIMSPGSTVCLDIDECATYPGPCDQNCSNTQGSYSCGCHEGYMLTSGSCLDEDECVSGTHSCPHVCSNAVGGYICSCHHGFGLSPADNTSCDDIDECSSGVDQCEQECLNTNGSYSCGCFTGFRQDPGDVTKCQDVDECLENPGLCGNDSCINTAGSFSCTCSLGFDLTSNTNNNKCGSIITTPTKCACLCPLTGAMTPAELQVELDRIRNTLAIDKRALSSYTARLSSIHDSRPSSQTIGCLSLLPLGALLAVFVLQDILKIILSWT